jgi:hypothetical protein
MEICPERLRTVQNCSNAGEGNSGPQTLTFSSLQAPAMKHSSPRRFREVVIPFSQERSPELHVSDRFLQEVISASCYLVGRVDLDVVRRRPPTERDLPENARALRQLPKRDGLSLANVSERIGMQLGELALLALTSI